MRSELFWLRVHAAILLAPGLLWLLLTVLRPPEVHPWLANASLGGVTNQRAPVAFSWESLASGAWTQSLTERFNEGFPGREWLIRWTGELHYRLFQLPATVTSPVVVGRDGSLFERIYLQERFLWREPQGLEGLVRDLARLQATCRRQGIAFLLVLTPNKATIYPASVPPQYERIVDPRPRGYTQLKRLLEREGVEVLDAVTLVERERQRASAPLYPQGGTHWGAQASWATANAVLERLREQGLPVTPTTVEKSEVSDTPGVDDLDVADLLNLASPRRFPVTRLKLREERVLERSRLSLVVVGDSFIWGLIDGLWPSGRFAEIDAYYYSRLYKKVFADRAAADQRSEGPARVPAAWEASKPTAWGPLDRDLFGADALVLEINEAMALHGRHLKDFTRVALGALPAPGTPPPTFRYESYAQLAPGQTLEVAGLDPHVLRGVTLDGRTEGPVAELRLQLPRPHGDCELALELESSLQLVAWVNDERLAVLPATPGSVVRLRIPAHTLGQDGHARVRLELPPGAPPATLRKVSLAALPPVVPSPLPWRPGQRLALRAGLDPRCLTGFSHFEKEHCWTVGPLATVSLQLPPGEGELTLRARVAPYLDARLQPAQRLRVYANDRLLGVWDLLQDRWEEREARLPRPRDGRLRLAFEPVGWARPEEAGLIDQRPLAVRFDWLRLDSAQGDPLQH